MASVLADAPFDQFDLVYTLESETQEGEDDFGNPVFVAAAPEKKTLRALVAPFKFDALRYQRDASEKNLIPMRGELIEPLEFPSEIKIGSKLELEYAGQAGILTITSIIKNDIPVAFGDFFKGDWLPSA